MGPPRKSGSVNKRYSNINDDSPVRYGEAADRRTPRKRKLSDMLGPQWSKEELERFYESYRKHGKDWKKVGALLRNRTVEMVEALYTMNRAYLSLPEGTASVAGLIAMMTDHYCNLAGSDGEQESKEGAGTSRKPQKRFLAKVPPKASKGPEGRLPLNSQAIASSYEHLSLLKKKRSGGSRPRVVGKRTPRFPVSYSHENANGNKHFSPTRQGLRFNLDATDSGIGHENLIALAEASQRDGSPHSSHSPKRMVGGCDMDEDDLEGSAEADNEDYSRDKRLIKAGSAGTLFQKGRRLYGKRLEVDNNKDNQDEIREACSGTEGQKLGPVQKKSEIEGTNGKTSRYSQGRLKRSKKILFDRDEGSAIDGLEALANAIFMPESTNDNDPSVQIKEESNEFDEPEAAEDIPANHQREKQRFLGIKGNQSVSGSKLAKSKTCRWGKDSVHSVSCSPEAKLENVYSVTKVSRKKQKTMASRSPTAEGHSDTHMSESQVIEGKNVAKIPTSKGKRSSQSASPKLNKHPENSSSSTGPRKEPDDSAMSTAVHIPGANQADITNKVKSRRKMKIRKAHKYVDSERSDRTEKLLNCFSNHRVRSWCIFEWFYSAIDYPWFAKREFVEYLLHVGLGHVPRLTRVEWGVIRSSLGKPRRFSEEFLKEEKEKLNRYRDSVRRHYAELRSGTREGLPTDLARPLTVGQRVIAIHPNTREIHDGSVLTVDHNRCRVQFDRPELGVEFVMDIDCMPLNPFENMPTSLARHTLATGLDNLNKLRMNGHVKDQRPEGYIKFSLCDNLETVDSDPHMSPAGYQTKMGFAVADSQAKMNPKDKVASQQMSYLQPFSRSQIQAKEADVQVLAELNRALEKKQVLISELREMNNEVLENQKDGVSTLKDSEPFKKQYAAILVQLRDADERVTSSLCGLKKRNTYQGNVSLTWPRSIITSGGSVGVFNASNCSELQAEESGSHVNEIVGSSRTRAHMMVNAAIQAFSSMKGGGTTFEKTEEAIDYVYDHILLDDFYVPSERSFTAIERGDLASEEQLKCNTLSSLEGQSSPQFKNPSVVLSELITNCVATLLMIQKCTERQFPPADVAQILDAAVTSLQPCTTQNLPVYTDVEKCMIMIRNQIMALVPTA